MGLLDNYLNNPISGSGYEGIANKALQQYSIPSGGMSFLDNISKYASQGMDFLNKYEKPIGLLGTGIKGYMESDMGQKQYDLQKQAFNYNKMLSEREKKRQEDAENQFALGFQNSSLGA